MAKHAPVLDPIDIGIEADDRKAIAGELAKLLADTYTLYLKTHAFHWNVTGPMFNTLHLMFETQYTELWAAVDLIAERIRTLGHPAPGSYAQFAKLGSIAEETGVPRAEDMVRQLVEGDFFGEAAILTGQPRSATLTAASDCELLELDRPALDEIAQRKPRVWEVLVEFHKARRDNTLENLIRGR